jgi:hypothetical protein
LQSSAAETAAFGLAIAQRFVKEGGAHVSSSVGARKPLDKAVRLIGGNVSAIEADQA